MLKIYTIGHSNSSQEEFISALQSVGIKTLVDVRSHPQSSRYPHFSEEPLRMALQDLGIHYHWAGRQLGGRRSVKPDTLHRALPEDMQGYADYMETDAFKRSAIQLINLAASDASCFMCAEKLPEDCHRSLISDYLILQGIQVFHLLPPSEMVEHHLRPEARRESQQLVYDHNTNAEFDLN